jgi:hypothetical protein
MDIIESTTLIGICVTIMTILTPIPRKKSLDE